MKCEFLPLIVLSSLLCLTSCGQNQESPLYVQTLEQETVFIQFVEAANHGELEYIDKVGVIGYYATHFVPGSRHLTYPSVEDLIVLDYESFEHIASDYSESFILANQENCPSCQTFKEAQNERVVASQDMILPFIVYSGSPDLSIVHLPSPENPYYPPNYLDSHLDADDAKAMCEELNVDGLLTFDALYNQIRRAKKARISYRITLHDCDGAPRWTGVSQVNFEIELSTIRFVLAQTGQNLFMINPSKNYQKQVSTAYISAFERTLPIEHEFALEQLVTVLDLE